MSDLVENFFHFERQKAARKELAQEARRMQDAASSAVQIELSEMRQRIAALEALLQSAQCPNCDGSGSYPRFCGNGEEVEQVQCQWCFERQAAGYNGDGE